MISHLYHSAVLMGASFEDRQNMYLNLAGETSEKFLTFS